MKKIIVSLMLIMTIYGSSGACPTILARQSLDPELPKNEFFPPYHPTPTV